MKQFSVGQTVETTRHTFWMTVSEKTPDGKYKCFFGSVDRNGNFDFKRFAGIYDAKDLKEYKW